MTRWSAGRRRRRAGSMARSITGERPVPESTLSLLVADGQAAPTSYAAYAQQGGYQALRKAVTHLTPAEVIAETGDAGLRGRGGSGVLAASKMAMVAAAQDQTRYVLCNAYDADTRSRAA